MAESETDDDQADLDLGLIVPEEKFQHPDCFDSRNYRRWEREIAEPIIRTAGFEIVRWTTEDGDSFGPLVRSVTVRKEGVEATYFLRMSGAAKKPELKMILFKRRGRFLLAACRGEHKGCNIMLKQRQRAGPCDHCMILDNENETISSVYERLSRGDA